MSFDAGSIKGSLDLDTTHFNKGFEEAHTHAESEGGRIREILESIAEVASEVAGPAFAQFGQQLQSAFAGFSEGPVIGTLNLIGLAAGTVREAVEGAGASFHQMGLEAEKAGVSAEFLSRLSAVGGTVGVSLEQLGVGFKILEQRAEEAGEGNKAAAEGFARLGLSAQQAAELAKEPQRLFEAVQQSIGKMQDAAERNTAALGVMGRQGANLVPLFAQSDEQFRKTADLLQSLGGTVSDSEVQMGESLGLLEGIFNATFAGIEKSVGKPVLKYLEDHMVEIVPKIKAFSDEVVAGIGGAWNLLSDAGEVLLPIFKEIVEDLEKNFGGGAGFKEFADTLHGEVIPNVEKAQPFFEQLVHTLGNLADLAGGELALKLEALGPYLTFIVKECAAGLDQLDLLVNKQKEVSGLNEAPKAKLGGLEQEDQTLFGRVSLAPEQLDQAKKLREDARQLVGRLDFSGAAEDEKKLNDLLRSALPAAQQNTLNDLIAQVGTLTDKGVSPEIGARVINANDASGADLQRGDVYGAIQVQSALLQQMKDLGDSIREIASRSTAGSNADSVPNDNGASRSFPGVAPSQAGPVMNVRVTANIDPTESANKVARKIMPAFRQLHQQVTDAAAGALMQQMAQKSMGG